MRTAFELVAWSAHRQPGAVALLDPESGHRLTYSELLKRIEGVATVLASRGVVRDELVATAMANTLDHAIILLALNRLGAIPVIINPRLKADEMVQLIRRDNIRTVIRTVAEGKSGTPADIDGVEELTLSAEVLSEGLRIDGNATPAFEAPRPEDPAFVFYTSGTTGLPKGVVIPHRAIEPRVLFMSTQAGLRFGGHNNLLGLMPIHHVIGFFGVFLGSLAFNGTWIPVTAFDPAQAVKWVEELDVTCLFASPTHFDALLATSEFAPEKLKSVDSVIFAGAAINQSILKRLEKCLQVPIVDIYGTTETMNSLFNPDATQERGLRPGYHSRVQFASVSESPSVALPAGVEGELVVDASADATFTHYLNNPEATAAKIVDGWYRTGDSGYVDDSGRVILTGRIDDMINTGAENVHAEEVEQIISRHPAVVEAAVVGLPDTRWGEVVTAVVVVSEPLTADLLDQVCLDSELANFKRPRRYFVVNELPRNAAMKVSRRTLREYLGAHAADQPNPETGFIQFTIEESQ
uniref:4-chlorobenzoate--CoA ligase n=3 Tax=unclassified Arthrobacter TaxID=235627 RepID=CBCL1_ARTSP|nr:RecName: Full=4-chlorobenzoate--CoA ligase; Short=4-CBA:CoA ligase [Arthrobacter sp.]P86832.1 RecName: Full=4-chlorobenzoate--CoA ligase; Short=4-CBA:CoA ligase [Arthrobacter sp.]AAC28265.1 4-chlorobenzoate CoA ligase [Arthrobacter sp. TM1]AAF78819.1 4-chlorobenzoate CoA ligase [Arthrobacter sp. TM1]